MPSRRQFMVTSSLAGSAMVGASAALMAGTHSLVVAPGHNDQETPQPQENPAVVKERPPRVDLDMVQEMVAKSHGDLTRVKELVVDEPRLVNACHDWTAGDFETALGAASHTGQREIALFLLENGARMDIFAATMLGHIDIVRAVLTAHPAMIDTAGPHGIPLIKHAEFGGEPAAEVFEYLKTLTS